MSGLSVRLVDLLLAARALEQQAVGSDRRAAFRTGRTVIGALLDEGYTASAVAAVLGVEAATVRGRAQRNGCLPQEFVDAVLSDAEIALLDPVWYEQDRGWGYPAARVVQALEHPL
ncbi:hypothetical protein [Okibacterium endophyticum]